ncbi:MAG: type II CAAX endopeptidase family protein [Bacilli bacterium]|jgi:membrane protease YdiL (CAAX protease family)
MAHISEFLKPNPERSEENAPSVFKQLLLFALGFLGLNVIALAVSTIVKAYLALQYPDPIAYANALQHISYAATINIVSYVILVVVMFIAAFDVINRLRKQFYRPSVIVKGIGYGMLILLATIALNAVYLAFGIELTDNANESSVTAIMKAYPFFSLIAFVIAGPIVEEITYRLGLFGLLNRANRYLAYVGTFLVFGLIHFDFTNPNIVNELLNLPFYIIAGLLFCYIYEKEGLTVSIYAHMTNNLVSFVFSFIGTDAIVRLM